MRLGPAWGGVGRVAFWEGEWGAALRAGSGHPEGLEYGVGALLGGGGMGLGFRLGRGLGALKAGRRRPLQQGFGSVSVDRWRDAARLLFSGPRGTRGGAKALGTRSCPGMRGKMALQMSGVGGS